MSMLDQSGAAYHPAGHGFTTSLVRSCNRPVRRAFFLQQYGFGGFHSLRRGGIFAEYGRLRLWEWLRDERRGDCPRQERMRSIGRSREMVAQRLGGPRGFKRRWIWVRLGHHGRESEAISAGKLSSA